MDSPFSSEFIVVWKYDREAKTQTAIIARDMPEGSDEELEKQYPYPEYEVQSFFGGNPGGVKEGETYKLGYDPLDWD